MTSSEQSSGRAHPTQAKYVAIALILAAVTAFEVAIVYMAFLGGVLAPILVVLSAVKFALVAMFFMHLRFDHRYFTYIFTFCMILGVSVFISALLMKSFAKTIQ